MMRVMLACGGTGGHITPALAIADTVKKNCPRAAILFVGGEGGMEEGLVRAAGYELRTLRMQGLSRSLSPSNLKALYLTVRARGGAREYLADFRPDVVIGTGGYACYPILSEAARMGIPTAVHESNAVPGLAVKRLSSRVTRVWLNFSEAAKGLSPRAKYLVVGNPLPTQAAGGKGINLPKGCTRLLLSFGGSLGATALNNAALSLMERLREHPDVFYLHATGKREYERVRAEFCARSLDACPHLSLVPFITSMASHMGAAELVVCRAGAMSISELAAAAAPAVLIPSPNVTGDHQLKNAIALSKRGAAVLLEEREIERLPDTVLALLADAARRRALSRCIGAMARPEANRLIFEDICRLI